MITHYMLSVCVFLTQCLVEGLSLPRLENVTIDSYNLHNVIRWSALQPLDNTTLKYVVQYKLSDTDTWKDCEGCAPTADTCCSFLPQHPYANVTLRVQAQAGNRTSPWSQTQPFVGHIQSQLGHPNVTLTPVDLHSLQIEIDPDANLRKLYGDALKYRVLYGKERDAFEIQRDLPSSVIINSLEAGVKYCFQVYYVIYPDMRLGNSASQSKCVTTEESEKERKIRIAWLSVIVIVLSGAFISGCIFVTIQNYSKVKESLWPDLSADSWIQELAEHSAVLVYTLEAICTEVAVKKGTAQQPQHLLKEEILWINKHDFPKIPNDRSYNSEETWDRVSLIIENDDYQEEES